jgi:hypothetical protein
VFGFLLYRFIDVFFRVCNFGQSQLLLNFACAARARGLDVSNVLVFATDQETKDLAESVGLTAFFDKRNFGSMPQKAAESYGDVVFTTMMLSKVCSQGSFCNYRFWRDSCTSSSLADLACRLFAYTWLVW